ncbi:MAG: hypothetical protein AAF996_01760 [Pseudomonadota bacterium]
MQDTNLAAYLRVINAALQSQTILSGNGASKLRDELEKAKAVLDREIPQ